MDIYYVLGLWEDREKVFKYGEDSFFEEMVIYIIFKGWVGIVRMGIVR